MYEVTIKVSDSDFDKVVAYWKSFHDRHSLPYYSDLDFLRIESRKMVSQDSLLSDDSLITVRKFR